MPDPRLSVVIPVFGNAATLPRVIERLIALETRLAVPIEAVFVVDGSPDDSGEVLRRELDGSPLQAQVVNLSRNFGSFPAIRAGMRFARGEYLAVMAADLQEPVEVVEDFYAKLAAHECDIVFGMRTGRDDPAADALGSRVYWWLYRRFVNSSIPPGGVDVFGCTRDVARRVIAFPETHTSLVGLLFWMGYRRAFVPYRRVAREDGHSGWSTRKKLRYLFDSIYAFTDLPIVLLQVLGAVGLAASIAGGLIIFGAWAAGAIKEPGYTPLMLAILGSSSAILVGLGVVGSYVWRAYENGKSRPLELVASHEEFSSESGTPGRSATAPVQVPLAAHASSSGRDLGEP